MDKHERSITDRDLSPDGDESAWYRTVPPLVERTYEEAMARIEIAYLDLTERAIGKAAWHKISEDQIYAVLGHVRVALRNRAKRVASHVLYGMDDQGRCLAIPNIPTDDPLIWRPIIAWYCKPSEVAILRKAQRS